MPKEIENKNKTTSIIYVKQRLMQRVWGSWYGTRETTGAQKVTRIGPQLVP